jgi:hypothetical protein
METKVLKRKPVVVRFVCGSVVYRGLTFEGHSSILVRMRSGDRQAPMGSTDQKSPVHGGEHRRHRRRRFHVRQEALGIGYEAFGPASEAEPEPPPQCPSEPAAGAEWEVVSEREIRRRVALNALRITLQVFLLGLAIIAIGRGPDWFIKVLVWLGDFPTS